MKNLGMRFMSEVQVSEARAFYGFQIAMENIHSECILCIVFVLKIKKKKQKLTTAT